MAGFSREKVRAAYGIPDGFEPVTAIAAGYPGDSETLPHELRQTELQERKRVPISKFVFRGAWNNRAF
jgi:hypothetical protein